MPTQEQIDNAKRAGWDPADGVPPGGWEAHGEFQEGLAVSDDPADLLDPGEEA